MRLNDIFLFMRPQFEAATMILPHWCNLNDKIIHQKADIHASFLGTKNIPESCLRYHQTQLSCLYVLKTYFYLMGCPFCIQFQVLPLSKYMGNGVYKRLGLLHKVYHKHL